MIRVVLGLLLWAMLSTGAFAQQGFDAGGLNTCSQSGPSASPFASTCYGYVNGVPTFFVSQPSTMTKPLQFANGQWGSLNVGLSISSAGVPTILSGGTAVFQVTSGPTNNGVIAIGPSADALQVNSGDYYTVAIGALSLSSKTALGGELVAVGWGTLRNLTTGNFATAVGHNAGGAITTEAGDTLFGNDAMRSSTGASNTCVGAGVCKYGAFASVTAMGSGALDSEQSTSPTTNVTESVFIGKGAGQSNNLATINFDNCIGVGACNSLTTGSQNNVLGWGAGGSLTTHGSNVMIGQQAGFNADANNETLVGWKAGINITSGASNTCVGENTCNTLVTGAGNIVIGQNQDVLAAATANEINIGGLLFYNNASTAAPALSACGTGSPTVDAHGNNRSGTITAGAGALASCTMTFAGSGYTTWNHCRVTSQSSVAALAYSYTLTTLTVTGTSITSDKFDYDCDGV